MVLCVLTAFSIAFFSYFAFLGTTSMENAFCFQLVTEVGGLFASFLPSFVDQLMFLGFLIYGVFGCSVEL